MNKSIFTVFFFLMICFVFSVEANAQSTKITKTGKDAFSEVPVKTRKQLKDRIQVLMLLQKAKDFEKLYEIFSEDTKKTNSKETFVKAYKIADKRESISEFSQILITEVYLLYPDYWMIKGCGEYVEKGRKKYYESQVEVSYENDDWYFSSLISPSVGFGTPLKKCKMP